MQPQDNFSVPRRALDVEDYIDIVRRHRSWIFGPTFAALVIAVVTAYLWPDTYVSQATIKVVPQQLPENFVQSTVNQQISDRINAMAQSILSRSTLTTIVQTYGLYPRERSRLPIEDVVEKMRKDITLGSVVSMGAMGNASGRPGTTAFQIQFAYENRNLAQKVVDNLASRFIDSNARERSAIGFGTQQFLKDQWDQSKRELDAIETRLATFRQQNLGHLPDERESNLGQLSALQARMGTINNSLSRVNQEKLLLETQLRIYKDQLKGLKEPSAEQAAALAKADRSGTDWDGEVRTLENQLIVLRERYKDTHPDVLRAQSLLNAAKRSRDQAAKQVLDDTKKQQDEQAKKPENAPVRSTNAAYVREVRDLDSSIKQVTGQIAAKELESQEYQRELKDADNRMKKIQAAVETIPLGEKQYSELQRDRDLAKAKFNEDSLKLGKSAAGQEMENRKQGETLEILDAASLPQTPTEPKRPILIALGTGLGLLIGIGFAGARELKDTSLKNLKDVRAYTQLAVLGSIPLLENDLVVRRRRRLAWLAWSVACVAGLAIMSGSVVYYYATKA